MGFVQQFLDVPRDHVPRSLCKYKEYPVLLFLMMMMLLLLMMFVVVIFLFVVVDFLF